MCFDKTGTLTEGHLSVDGLHLLVDRVDVEFALGALAAADPSPNATMRAVAAAFPAPAGWQATRTIPFSSARKWTAASFGRLGTWILGSPEMVLPGDSGGTGMAATAASSGKRALLPPAHPAVCRGLPPSPRWLVTLGT